MTANILIVDDTPNNLHLLVRILTESGYTVRPARNGRIALTSAQAEPPDLILLDIMMPEMDGYAVCQQLKANPQTSDIPIIFLSALDDTEAKLKSFQMGGVDYVTKPFQAAEVLARVQTHLTIRRLQQDLQTQVAELDAFAHTVAHDLKSPLAIVVGFAEFLMDVEAMAWPEARQIFQHLVTGGHKAVNIINELLLLSSVRKQDVPLEVVAITAVIAPVLDRLAPMIEKYQAEITLPESWPTALGYAPWLEELWVNYISNGLKYGGQPPHLQLGATPLADGTIQFWVQDDGSGLTPEAQATLFAEFTRLDKVRAEGHGLGLSIVRRIADKLGGQVGVTSELGQGSRFYFTLPPIP